jgi:hypothetical protein
MLRFHYAVRGVVLVAAIVPGVSPLLLAQSPPDGAASIVLPKRRAPDASPAPPPPLPLRADSIRPTTIALVTRRLGPSGEWMTMRQTASRTAERIHLIGKEGREWLFERNPVDTRRVSATQVEHTSKTIVLYDDTDLRMALGIRGWADILMFGFDSALARDCKPGSAVRIFGSSRFRKCNVTNASAGGAVLWWSDTQLLATPFAVAGDEGQALLTIEAVHDGVDAVRLVPAIQRFPAYRVSDYADWLEHH